MMNKERLWDACVALQQDDVLKHVYALPFLNVCSEISQMTKLLGSALKFAGEYMDTLLARVRAQVADADPVFEPRFVHYGPSLHAMVRREPVEDMHTIGSVRHSVSRLIWLLDFTEAFVTNLVSIKFEDRSLADCAHAAYEDRLAQNHKWLVRKAVRLSLHCCPSRDRLQQCVTHDELVKLHVLLQKPVAYLYNFCVISQLTLAVEESA